MIKLPQAVRPVLPLLRKIKIRAFLRIKFSKKIIFILETFQLPQARIGLQTGKKMGMGKYRALP